MKDDIKLPQLPDDSETPASSQWEWSNADMQDYAREAIKADRQRTTDLLKNPVHVHTNMCRGIIAPITFDQLAHVLGDAATQEWLASRQQRGEPVGYVNPQEFEYLKSLGKKATVYSSAGLNFRPVYAAPQRGASAPECGCCGQAEWCDADCDANPAQHSDDHDHIRDAAQMIEPAQEPVGQIHADDQPGGDPWAEIWADLPPGTRLYAEQPKYNHPIQKCFDNWTSGIPQGPTLRDAYYAGYYAGLKDVQGEALVMQHARADMEAATAAPADGQPKQSDDWLSPTSLTGLEKDELIRQLQWALAYWMPPIAGDENPDAERCARDAYLLLGMREPTGREHENTPSYWEKQQENKP